MDELGEDLPGHRPELPGADRETLLVLDAATARTQ